MAKPTPITLTLSNEELAVQKHLLRAILDTTDPTQRAAIVKDYGTFCHACRQLRIATPLSTVD